MYVRKHNDFFIMDCKIQVDELQNNIIKVLKGVYNEKINKGREA